MWGILVGRADLEGEAGVEVEPADGDVVAPVACQAGRTARKSGGGGGGG